MNDMSQRLKRLRAWVGEDDDRRNREVSLPKALCRVCGGWAKAGEGTRDDAPTTGLVPHPTDPTKRLFVKKVDAPNGADDWRRQCSSCARANLSEIVEAVVGIEVETRDAQAVVLRMKSFDDELGLYITFPTAQSVGKATGNRWGHLGRDDRDRVRQVLRGVIDERLPGVSQWGACGLCGRRHSIRWFEGPPFMKWSDGSNAPVCAECQQVMDRRPTADSIDHLRAIAVEAATGYAQMLYSAPPEFRCYFEARDSDGNGYATPWDYSDGIREFREQVWEDLPYLAPESRRRDFEQRRLARINEAQQQEQMRRDQQQSHAW